MIRAVLARYPQVHRAIIYVSRALGTAAPGSDIDLTLVGGADLTLDVLSLLMHDLDDLPLPYTFDLSIFSMITDPDVRAHIERACQLFYAQSPQSNCKL